MSRTEMKIKLHLNDDNTKATLRIISDNTITAEDLADILYQYADKLLEFADSMPTPVSKA